MKVARRAAAVMMAAAIKTLKKAYGDRTKLKMTKVCATLNTSTFQNQKKLYQLMKTKV